LKGKGAIIASSSSPGEYSVGTASGGLYTNQFLSALRQSASETNPDWNRLMRTASKTISYQGGSKRQRPQHGTASSCSSSTLSTGGDNSYYPSELDELYTQLYFLYVYLLWIK
jgi:hypothetical protein